MANTSYDKGAMFDGGNDFKILHGGAIRSSFPIADNAAFEPGNLVMVHDDGEVYLSSDPANATDYLLAVTVERANPRNTPYEDDTMGSGKAAVILDEAVIITREVSSGINITVNDILYQDGIGNFTNSPPTNDDRSIGIALSDYTAGTSETLEVLYTSARPTS